MRRLAVAMLVAFPLIFSVNPPSSPASAADCRFVLGFKALHDAIPEIVGDCLRNEHFNGRSGDTVQETTGTRTDSGYGGLLVWRKADNWTAFTDGYRTWINGPYGIQVRLNTEQFEWEEAEPTPDTAAAPAATPKPTAPSCSFSDIVVKLEQMVPGRDGAAYVKGMIRNTCSVAVDAMVDMFAHASKDGPVVADAPTIWIPNLAPNSSREITTRIPNAATAPWMSWRVATADSEEWCNWDPKHDCLTFDRWLFNSLWALSNTDDGQELLTAAAGHDVTITRGSTPIGVLGAYSTSTRTIIIDTRLDAYSSWVRAAVIAHELSHAVDDITDQWPTTSSECYAVEESAFRQEARVWGELWSWRLPTDVDAVHSQLNDVALSVARDPVGFGLSLTRAYGDDCG